MIHTHILNEPVPSGYDCPGADNLTATAVTNLGNYDYQVQDASGRILRVNLTGRIDFSAMTNVYQFLGNIDSLQYDGAPSVIPPSNALSYSWEDTTNPNILEQEVYVEGQFNAHANYQSVSSTTAIVVIDSSGTNTYTKPGITPIVVTTSSGALGFAY